MTTQDVFDYFGGKAETAKALGISYQAVDQWKSVPRLRQFEIQHPTNGKLRVERKAA